MGDGADHANETWGILETRTGDADAYYGKARRKSGVRFDVPKAEVKPKKKKKKKSSSKAYSPATDEEAKQLIRKLDHYEWDTHKVSGRFDRNPYTLTAMIRGKLHTIKLAGRFGGVLRWLDQEERRRYQAA